MYCWTSIPGYSLIGKYTGTGTTDFPIIYTGFTPAWLMIKRTDSTGNWCIYDNKRDTTNPNNAVLVANSNNAQSYYTSGYEVNFYNNGFQIAVGPSIDINTAGGDYIFMCFLLARYRCCLPVLSSSYNDKCNDVLSYFEINPEYIALAAREAA